MSASSRSSASFTTSRAVSSAEGSMRMSSGASAAYEKPRSGRSSCIDETPRSSRIASAPTPFAASWPSTVENSPESRRIFSALPRCNRSKYGATLGSRSIAISLPWPCSRSASRPEWPPAPNVQSITVSPGRSARTARTSSARTGTWSVSIGKTLGNIFCGPFPCLQLLGPRGAIPDLEVVADAGDRDLASDALALDQQRGDHDAALLVQVDGRCVGEEVALHPARVDGEAVEAADPRGEPVPRVAGVDVEAPVHPACDDDVIAELLAELRGEREAVLVVE